MIVLSAHLHQTIMFYFKLILSWSIALPAAETKGYVYNTSRAL